MMQPTTKLLCLAGVALGLSNCQTQQNLAQNQSSAQQWLDMQKASSRIQVSGTWFSSEWGRADLKQKGREISGAIDTYQVKGVASGDKAYLTTWDSGKCYYAIVLEKSGGNVLSGSYTDGPSYKTDAKEQRPVELRRSY